MNYLEELNSTIDKTHDFIRSNDIDPPLAAAAFIDYLGFYSAIMEKDEEDMRAMFALIETQRKLHWAKITSSLGS